MIQTMFGLWPNGAGFDLPYPESSFVLEGKVDCSKLAEKYLSKFPAISSAGETCLSPVRSMWVTSFGDELVIRRLNESAKNNENEFIL